MSWMQTHTGVAFTLDVVKPENVRLDDIVFALSHNNRYTGHAGRYSVAEHCCHVSDHLLNRTGNCASAMAGLLHDAHEAYTGDLNYPMQLALGKEFCERWKAKSREIDIAILQALNLHGLVPIYDSDVKRTDVRILLDERNALMSAPPQDWDCEFEDPLDIIIYRWRPEQAGVEWRTRFHSLDARIQRP